MNHLIKKKKIALTTEEWLKSPRKERMPCKWYWPTGWYDAPFAMMMNDWDNWEKHIKKEYPIQYWLRENFHYTFRRLYYIIRNLKHRIFIPRRRMRNALFTHKWIDLVELVPQFHFQAIIEYVEEEKAFKEVVWAEDLVNLKTVEVGKKLKEYYNYVKNERPYLIDKLSLAYERVEIISNPSVNPYDEVNRIEEQIKTKDTELCIWVVNNRDYLWT